MAKIISTRIVDDLGGPGAAETVRFTYKGEEYSIDLNTRNRASLDRALSRFIAVARKGSDRPERYVSHPHAAEIREWGRENGYDVPERGRLPFSLMNAWEGRNL